MEQPRPSASEQLFYVDSKGLDEGHGSKSNEGGSVRECSVLSKPRSSWSQWRRCGGDRRSELREDGAGLCALEAGIHAKEARGGRAF